MNDESKSVLLQAYFLRRKDLRRFFAVRLGSDDAADDLVQELFFRLNHAEFTREINNPIAYLFTMALNIIRGYRRETQRSQQRDAHWVETTNMTLGNEAIADLPDPDAAVAAKQKIALVVAALDELSPQCRNAFHLHKFKGLSHAEIAERLHITRSTVEKHMNTALKHLVKRLSYLNER